MIRDKEDVIGLFNKIHDFEYDYSSYEYVDENTKSFIIHKMCNTKFLSSFNTHGLGVGCPKCGSKSMRRKV